MIFEDPFWPCMVLALAELAIVAVWWLSRSRRLRLAMAGPPVLAAAVFLVAALVVTDREKIIAASRAIAADIEAGRTESLQRYLDERFAARYRDARLDKAAAIEICGSESRRYAVSSVKLARPEVRVQARQATLNVLVDMNVDSSLGTYPVRLRMELRWVKAPDGGWTILQAQEPVIADFAG